MCFKILFCVPWVLSEYDFHHRDTEDTEKTESEIERMLGPRDLAFRLFFSVISVSPW